MLGNSTPNGALLSSEVAETSAIRHARFASFIAESTRQLLCSKRSVARMSDASCGRGLKLQAVSFRSCEQRGRVSVAGVRPDQSNIPGLRFHPLNGRDKGRYAVERECQLAGNFCVGRYRCDRCRSGGLPLMTRNPLLLGLTPSHPGAHLREIVLPALGKPAAEIARLLGISQETLCDMLAERQPVSAGMALRLGKLCGNGPELWIDLQRAIRPRCRGARVWPTRSPRSRALRPLDRTATRGRIWRVTTQRTWGRCGCDLRVHGR